MGTLFIIGNGFDLEHNLETKYEHFKAFLEEKNNEKDTYVCNEVYTLPDGTESISEDLAVEIIYQVISDSAGESDNWWNFEELLGRLDFSEINDLAENVFIKDSITGEYDLDYSSTEENVRFVFQAAVIAFDVWLPKLFREWILKIEDDLNRLEPIEDVQKLINSKKDAYFINFNYTSTLESLYKVEKVFHIHGNSETSNDLILGHKAVDPDIKNHDAREENEQLILKILEKNTEDAKLNLNFFWKNSINYPVDEIIIIGHSMGSVDQGYFNWIFRHSPVQNILINNDKCKYRELSDSVKEMFCENKKESPKIQYLKI